MEEKAGKGGAKFNLETILKELGSFGRYHVLMLFLLAFRDSFLHMCNLNYIFTTTTVEYRCQIAECETELHAYDKQWLSLALPNDTKCHRYHYTVADYQNRTWLEEADEYEVVDLRSMGNSSCLEDKYDRRKLVECKRWVYANQNALVSEFNLGCQDWKSTMVGTVHNIGLVVSLLLSGIISDRYGRKTIIVGTPLIVGVFGLAKSFSVNYWMLVILEFLESALGYGNASLVLSLECVSHDRRVVFACILDMMTNFGGMFLGLFAWLFPYWRTLIRVIYTPLFVVFFYIFLVDEGVRWLLTKGRKEEAIRILNKVAKVNNIKFSSIASEMMDTFESPKEEKTDQTQVPLLKSLRSKSIWARLITCSFCHLCCSFIYNGMLVNAANSHLDKYLKYSLALLVTIPTRVVTIVALNKFGRRLPMAVSMFLCATFLVSASTVPRTWPWVEMALFLCGKMAVSFGMYTLTVYTLETFPTCARNSLTNISCTIGKLGTVLSPQIPLMAAYNSSLPNLMFGVIALIAGSTMIFMPDKGNDKLPDNIQEVEETDDQDTHQDTDKEAA